MKTLSPTLPAALLLAGILAFGSSAVAGDGDGDDARPRPEPARAALHQKMQAIQRTIRARAEDGTLDREAVSTAMQTLRERAQAGDAEAALGQADRVLELLGGPASPGEGEAGGGDDESPIARIQARLGQLMQLLRRRAAQGDEEAVRRVAATIEQLIGQLGAAEREEPARPGEDRE